MHDRGDRNNSAEDSRPEPPREKIIDVSGPDPVIVERVDDATDFPFAGYAPERVRVFVSGGGKRACAIPVIFILLTFCCACIGLYAIADNIF